jgi:putative phosphoribosyl transferase
LSVYRDREEAGCLLGEHLKASLGGPSVVLGIPRGGVILAALVARALGSPLDVIVPRKIGAPGEPELAVGALAVARGREIALFDDRSLSRLGLAREDLKEEVERQRREILRREAAYRQGTPPLELAGKTVVIVDDGIATGLTARAAGKAVLSLGASEVIVAAPVAPEDTVRDLRRAGLRVEVLSTPSPFMAVGQFYGDFHPVSDAEVLSALGGPR